MEEDVSDINDDKNEKYYKRKEAECIDETLPDDMEERVRDRNNNKNEKYDQEEKEGETTNYKSTTMDEGKGVIDERGGKDVDEVKNDNFLDDTPPSDIE